MISTRQLCLATATKAATVFLIAVALVARPSSAQTLNPGNSLYVAGVLKPAAAGGGGGGDPCSSCTNETFEGTGTVLTGWRVGDNTSANNITNVDFTAVALTGAQSLWLGNPDSQSSYLAKTIASTANVGWRFTLYVTNASITAATNMQVCTADDNVGNPMASVVIHATGFRINHGTANATTATQIPTQTKIYVWGRRVAGSGANGTAYITWSTGKIKPTSGAQYASLTTGSTTANTTDFGLWLKDVAFGSQRCGIVLDDVSIFPGGEPGDFE